MGRKAGGKNFGKFTEYEVKQIEISEEERKKLPEVFTCINKDFIGIQDLIDSSSLSYDTCAKIIREIKSVSDVFGISGFVHRTDYFLFFSKKFTTINQKVGEEA